MKTKKLSFEVAHVHSVANFCIHRKFQSGKQVLGLVMPMHCSRSLTIFVENLNAPLFFFWGGGGGGGVVQRHCKPR